MLSPDLIARIKSAKGLYTVRDTADFFNVSKSCVHDIWAGRRHTQVKATHEPPNIASTRPLIDTEDIRNLLDRGKNVSEVADVLGVSRSTIYAHINRAPMLYVTGGGR